MAHIHIGKGEYTRRTYTHILIVVFIVSLLNGKDNQLHTTQFLQTPGGLFYIHYCFVLQKKKDLLLFIFFILEFLVCCPVCVCVYSSIEKPETKDFLFIFLVKRKNIYQTIHFPFTSLSSPTRLIELINARL